MPSRLIVKNLPKHLTQDRFKKHFEAKGTVTDAHLVHTGQGVFRRFGYIGYKSDKEAEAAQAYFNHTYIDTSRIAVEFAKAAGDVSLPRPWSRYSEGSSRHTKTHPDQTDSSVPDSTATKTTTTKTTTSTPVNPRDKKKQLDDKKEQLLRFLYADEEDDKLKEFLQVMRPRAAAKGQTWANDDGLPMVNKKGESSRKSDVKVGTAGANNEEDDEYQDLPVLAEQPTGINPETLIADADLETSEDTPEEQPQDSVAFDSAVSDLEYLRSKMKVNPVEHEISSHSVPAQIHPSRMALRDDMDTVSELQASSPIAPASNVHPSRLERMEDKADATTVITPPSTPAQHIEAEELPSDAAPEETEKEEHLKDDALVEESPLPPVELIGDTGRLFVRNLTYTVDKTELETLFSAFGPVSEIHIPIFRDTKLQKGFAFVEFLMPEHAVQAYSSLDGSIFQGRILEILPGKEKLRKDEEEEDESGGKKSFKSKKEKAQKAKAGNEFNWNSLFMNSDAVADAMAKKLGVKKSDVLNVEGSNMAVKLALAETNIIQETKAYLEDEGVNLTAFSVGQRALRSSTVILVKNLPASTVESDLLALFEPFGSLGRLLLPPAKTLGLVEFLEENEAKVAFTSLAYTRFKYIPLFLEWAPIGVFKSAFDKTVVNERRNARHGVVIPKKSGEDEEEAQAHEDPDGAPTGTLFVKNLNFDTREPGLLAAFSGAPGLRTARIPTKTDKKRPGQTLSLGYGFLEFESRDKALSCLKSMQGLIVDGHVVSLKFSNASMKSGSTSNGRSGSSTAGKVTAPPSSKLIVRNVPFEASKKELKDLFSSFGQVKTVRLPTKFDGSHRGFAFVDFLTRQEAASAFETLQATHLYGRHLVLEWATEGAEADGSVEALRAKTARAFVGEGDRRSKRARLDDEDEFHQAQNDAEDD